MLIKPATGLVVALTVALGASVGVTSTASAAASDRARDNARAALALAKAALHGRSPDRPHASDALRQVMMTRDALSGSDARQARSVLSRPSNGVGEFPGAPVWPADAEQHGQCGVNVCVHWVEEGTHAADPAYAAEVLAESDHVAQTYIDAGYRSTLPDAGQGSNAIANTMPDIYLANVGVDELYGYCTSDALRPVDGSAYYAFCVLDNDFSQVEFPGENTPTENMQVTAAHEYFHAVQFAYDAWDDTWIYETTATWAEDEVYDDVNDNWAYLPTGQLGDPAASVGLVSEGAGVSLDLGDFAYGNWIFFRYLSERLVAQQATMPTVVRDVWSKLDTTGGKPDRYSLQAVGAVLTNRGTSMKKQYGQFALENNTPTSTYEEGAAYPSPAPAFNPVQLSADRKSVSRTVTLDHLTSGTGRFLPFASGYRLRVSADMTSRTAGSLAAVAVHRTDGVVDRSWIALNREGNGTKTVAFDVGQVEHVEVTLVNASTQMVRCGQDPAWRFSCGGFGRYEDQRQKLTVTAVR